MRLLIVMLMVLSFFAEARQSVAPPTWLNPYVDCANQLEVALPNPLYYKDVDLPILIAPGLNGDVPGVWLIELGMGRFVPFSRQKPLTGVRLTRLGTPYGTIFLTGVNWRMFEARTLDEGDPEMRRVDQWGYNLGVSKIPKAKYRSMVASPVLTEDMRRALINRLEEHLNWVQKFIERETEQPYNLDLNTWSKLYPVDNVYRTEKDHKSAPESFEDQRRLRALDRRNTNIQQRKALKACIESLNSQKDKATQDLVQKMRDKLPAFDTPDIPIPGKRDYLNRSLGRQAI